MEGRHRGVFWIDGGWDMELRLWEGLFLNPDNWLFFPWFFVFFFDSFRRMDICASRVGIVNAKRDFTKPITHCPSVPILLCKLSSELNQTSLTTPSQGKLVRKEARGLGWPTFLPLLLLGHAGISDCPREFHTYNLYSKPFAILLTPVTDEFQGYINTLFPSMRGLVEIQV